MGSRQDAHPPSAGAALETLRYVNQFLPSLVRQVRKRDTDSVLSMLELLSERVAKALTRARRENALVEPIEGERYLLYVRTKNEPLRPLIAIFEAGQWWVECYRDGTRALDSDAQISRIIPLLAPEHLPEQGVASTEHPSAIRG